MASGSMQIHVHSKKEMRQVRKHAVAENPTIFIVDSDKRDRESVSALMSRLGYRTAVFGSAEELLEGLDSEAMKGCVISEMQLPGMSGLDLYTILRDRRLGLAFIILTSDSDISSAVGALHRKVSDYVMKPVVERDLTTRVRDALRRVNTRRGKRVR